ncbi:TRAP transporter substrate-binding protein DctP [Amorphus orientalis]|uniref:Tripartite ATP-independent transporter DctP family solute receptor n=1 Tax=Amorphus orientalis TaxID=649198 RepID=A0AAE4ATQ2_9HYPH|nr:TRAP transporter substrate-binding protein DctP [Amorphus orientalis]MDQ0315194.1 tripartite ATP-independent transporter DctP family solute receptor [Amorphus orientalis]
MKHISKATLTGRIGRGALGAALLLALPVTAASADPVKLRFSTPAPPGEILTQSMEIFGDILQATAPDAFEVSVHPGGTLFKQGTEIPAMQRGNLEMNTLQTFEVAQFVPELSVFNAGYLFDDYDHLKAVWGSEIGEDYRAKVEEDMGVHILADCYLGTREVALNQVRNVKTPEDMQGIKLRMPGAPDFLLLGKGLGVDPTPMAMSEVYLGMKAGTVDGQDNPVTITRAAKLDEVTKEVVLTDHMVQNVFYAIATPVYEELSADLQGKLTAAAVAACAWNDTMRLADEDKQIAYFKEQGIVVSEPDLDAFRAHMAKVYEDEGRSDDWSEDLIEKIKAAND